MGTAADCSTPTTKGLAGRLLDDGAGIGGPQRDLDPWGWRAKQNLRETSRAGPAQRCPVTQTEFPSRRRDRDKLAAVNRDLSVTGFHAAEPPSPGGVTQGGGGVAVPIGAPVAVAAGGNSWLSRFFINIVVLRATCAGTPLHSAAAAPGR